MAERRCGFDMILPCVVDESWVQSGSSILVAATKSCEKKNKSFLFQSG